MSKEANLDSTTMAHIIRDIAANISPQKSKLKYTKEAMDFRAKVISEWEKHRKINPKARLEVPTDIEGLS